MATPAVREARVRRRTRSSSELRRGARDSQRSQARAWLGIERGEDALGLGGVVGSRERAIRVASVRREHARLGGIAAGERTCERDAYAREVLRRHAVGLAERERAAQVEL